jgi:hypothetical protein
MKHELRHWAYAHTKGGLSVNSHRHPHHPKSINSLDAGGKKMSQHYIGHFSEWNPIGLYGGYSISKLAVLVKKETSTTLVQKEFKLEGKPNLGDYTGYHGSDFNNNHGVSFSKQQLLTLAAAMDDTDRLMVLNADSVDRDIFYKGIEAVTGVKIERR